MSRKANVILALLFIITLGAVGFLGYRVLYLDEKLNTPGEPSSGLVHSWFTRTNDSVLANGTLEPMNQLNTTINVSEGEWVYISFSCNAKIQITGSTRAALEFFIILDGKTQWIPTFVLDQMPDTDNDNEWTPVTFFALLPNVSSGSHDITIGVMTAYGACEALVGGGLTNSGSNLLIQTIIP
ncbi:MAG: hypothetical protein ACTSXU_09075 [Promethearchaeota archaeon]